MYTEKILFNFGKDNLIFAKIYVNLCKTQWWLSDTAWSFNYIFINMKALSCKASVRVAFFFGVFFKAVSCKVYFYPPCSSGIFFVCITISLVFSSYISL